MYVHTFHPGLWLSTSQPCPFFELVKSSSYCKHNYLDTISAPLLIFTLMWLGCFSIRATHRLNSPSFFICFLEVRKELTSSFHRQNMKQFTQAHTRLQAPEPGVQAKPSSPSSLPLFPYMALKIPAQRLFTPRQNKSCIGSLSA